MPESSPIVAFSGPSGSGKTTLIEKLIIELAAQKIVAGVIKRTHHTVDIDREGKDSYRFAMAGANPVALLSDDHITFMERTKNVPTLAMVAQMFVGKADILLVEGWSDEALPRFVFGAAEGGYAGEILGLISDDSGDSRDSETIPMMHRDESKKICKVIVKRFLPRPRRFIL